MTNLFPFSEFNFEKAPFLIAGPCSAETPEQLRATVFQLVKQNIQLIRAGVWKPRTRPRGFEGVGALALPWISDVKREFQVRFAVEVASASHVEEALKAGIDVFWIGARSTVNPFTVQEIAESLRGVDIPVLIKNPVNPDLALWLGAFERLESAGLNRLGAIHRGFSNYRDTIHRNSPMWQIPIEFRTIRPEIPMINDPSHISGKRILVPEIAQKALDLNFDGLMIESHYQPDTAWTDAAQQLTPEALGELIGHLKTRKIHFEGPDALHQLEEIRQQIDESDRELLEAFARRMHLVEKIGEYKKANNVAAFQRERWQEVFQSRPDWGRKLGLNSEAVEEIYRVIHQESIRKQTEILDK